MGSCVSSFHKSSGSSKVDRISVIPDSNSMPPTPIKDKPTNINNNNVDPQIVSFNRKSRISPFNSISSLRSIGGSKDEAFYDTQGWLDSDCDDDFYSVNGDFTPSRGSTPVHQDGTPRLSRVFSPQVSRAVFEGKKHIRSASYQSRGSPLARRSFSSTTQATTGSFSEEVTVTSPTTTPIRKSKNLLDLFKESMRERGDVGLTHPFLDLPPKPTTTTRAPSSLRYVSSSDPADADADADADNHVHVKDKQGRFSHGCFPKLAYVRSLSGRKKTSAYPPSSMDDLKA